MTDQTNTTNRSGTLKKEIEEWQAYTQVLEQRALDDRGTLNRALSEFGESPCASDPATALLRVAEATRRAVGPAWFRNGSTLVEAIESKCRALERLGDERPEDL